MRPDGASLTVDGEVRSGAEPRVDQHRQTHNESIGQSQVPMTERAWQPAAR